MVEEDGLRWVRGRVDGMVYFENVLKWIRERSMKPPHTDLRASIDMFLFT